MTYRLLFLPSALKEWRTFGGNVREQFKKRLAERLEEPRIASARLHGSSNRYKIKLRAAGYRLIYQVNNTDVTATVIAVGRRDGNAVYQTASKR